jgi:hypothetical protein
MGALFFFSASLGDTLREFSYDDVESCQVSLSDGSRALLSLFYQPEEFQSRLARYHLSKSQFVQFVLGHYDHHIREVSGSIAKHFFSVDH